MAELPLTFEEWRGQFRRGYQGVLLSPWVVAKAAWVAGRKPLLELIQDALLSLDPNEETQWAKHAHVVLERRPSG